MLHLPTLAGLVFRDRKQESWLSRKGLGIYAVLFPIMALAFHAVFVKMSNFRAPSLPYAGAALVVALLIVAGLQLKARPALLPPLRGPTWFPGIVMFMVGISWLLLYGEIFRTPHLLHVTFNLALGIGLAAGFALSLRRWAPAGAPDQRQFSLIAGGLAANTAFGFVVVSGSTLDTYGQIGLVLLGGVGLCLLGRTLRAS